MTELIPPVSLDDIDNRGERKALECLLAQLPAGSRIYHNFRLLTAENRKGAGAQVRLKQGEIDAILPEMRLVPSLKASVDDDIQQLLRLSLSAPV